MRMNKQVLAIVAVLGSAGCATVAERPADLAPLRPAPAQVEALVRAVLSDRFVARDIPDQNLLDGQDPVCLFDEMERSAYHFGSASLSNVAGKHFVLVTRTQARDLAYGRSGLWLLEVDDVEVNDSRAKLRIGVSAYPDVT